MRGSDEQSARSIALDLLHGAAAEIVGTKSLKGSSPHYMEIDGVPVGIPQPELKEAAGVRTRNPDGFVALYLATTYERARGWLIRAEQIVAEVRHV